MNTHLTWSQILLQPSLSTGSKRFRRQGAYRHFLLLLGFGLLFAAINTRATTVAFNFSGTITNSRDDANWFQGAFPNGGSFSGKISYDTDLSSSGTPGPSDPGSVMQYAFNMGATDPAAMSVTGLGGHTFTSATPFYINTYDNYGVNPSYPGLTPFDELYYASYDHFNFDGSALTMNYYFADFGVHFNSRILTSTTSITLPGAAPNLADFANSYFNVYVFSGTGNGPLAVLEGRITSVTPIPEPGGLGLFSCGVLVVICGLLRRWHETRQH
jgi:hypothetical protein